MGWKRKGQRENEREIDGTMRDDERWKKVEEGWLREESWDGQETLRDHSRVGTEVVVRNDNTSTDISIIHARGTIYMRYT